MIYQEIRNSLLSEHARDKKLTYVSFGLLAVVIITATIFLGRYILDSIQMDALYPKIALSSVLIFYIGFVILKFIKLGKREKEIDELISQLKSGSKATNIVELREHKIIIPLGKITFRLCPVDFFNISLDTNPLKFYKVPVHPTYTTDFKNALSGVDMEVVNQTFNSLYLTDDTEYNQPSVPLKTVDEFRKYLHTELANPVKDIEAKRKKSKKTMFLFGGISVVGVILFMAYMLYTGYNIDYTTDTTPSYAFVIPVVVFFVLFYGGYYIFFRPKHMKAITESDGNIALSPEHQFKNEVFSKIIHFISPDVQYSMHGHISKMELLESGLFRDRSYEITGNDLVMGRHNGVPFQFCDLTVTVRKSFSRENEEPECAFYGQYFVARFNKSFTSPVYIVPKKELLKSFSSSDDITYSIDVSGEKVILEDPDFMKMFTVYSENQIEARYILTPSLMERIKQMTIRAKGQLYISFHKNKITVANNSYKNNFEISQYRSLTKNNNKVIVDFYQDLYDQFSIIDDLKLNIKIWK